MPLGTLPNVTCNLGRISVATQLEWDNTKANMRWSLKDPGSDEGGRHKMQDALASGDVARSGQLQIGFHETQSDRGIRDQYDNCKREDERRLFNIGREILGMSPV